MAQPVSSAVGVLSFCYKKTQSSRSMAHSDVLEGHKSIQQSSWQQISWTKGYVILEPCIAHQAKPFLVQPCTASNFWQCKCAIKVAACPLARQRYGDMGARCLSQPNLWVVPRASMPWTALKKFGILSAQRARIGIKPFIPASHAENTFPLSAGVSRPYLPPAPNTATETLILFFSREGPSEGFF